MDSGEIHPSTSHQKFEGYWLYSPDGSQIAYWYPSNGDSKNQNEIMVTAASGGDGASVTHAINRQISSAIWMPNGKSLLVGGSPIPSAGIFRRAQSAPLTSIADGSNGSIFI